MTARDPVQRHIFVAGATGTIGQAVVTELLSKGHAVTCLVRQDAQRPTLPMGVAAFVGDVTNAEDLLKVAQQSQPFDAAMSCLASRTGVSADAWAIDHDANVALLRWAEAHNIPKFVLLSAICVQKPRLAFQHAKLAFEAKLQASHLDWTIVRPTAFFKSLSGQIERCLTGKAYLVFGSGDLTACKPISDADLARFLSACVDDPQTSRKILPIGGPGPAITPLDQAEELFRLLGRPLRIRHVPLSMMRCIAGSLKVLSRLIPRLEEPAAYAEIGLYYAQESMLVWNEKSQAYEEHRTPEYGADTLFEHYAARVTQLRAASDAGEDHASRKRLS